MSEGFEQGSEHHADQSGSKADIIEIVSLVHPQGIGGERRQNKPDQQTDQTADKIAKKRGAILPDRSDLGDDRSERCSEKGYVDITGKRLLLIEGVEVAPDDDREDVADVFTEQGKTRHQKQAGHTDSGKWDLGYPKQKNRDERHQPRIDKCRANSTDQHGIGNQDRLRGDDLIKPDCDLPRRIKQEAISDQQEGKDEHGGLDEIAGMFCVVG